MSTALRDRFTTVYAGFGQPTKPDDTDEPDEEPEGEPDEVEDED
jgi:hypothetical protein